MVINHLRPSWDDPPSRDRLEDVISPLGSMKVRVNFPDQDFDSSTFPMDFVNVRSPRNKNHMGVSKNSGTPKWMVYKGKPY